MKLTAEQIQSNWKVFLNNIKTHIPGNRGEQLLNFYKRYEERVILMPAAHKKEYHGCLLYTSQSPRDRQKSRMPSSA